MFELIISRFLFYTWPADHMGSNVCLRVVGGWTCWLLAGWFWHHLMQDWVFCFLVIYRIIICLRDDQLTKLILTRQSNNNLNKLNKQNMVNRSTCRKPVCSLYILHFVSELREINHILMFLMIFTGSNLTLCHIFILLRAVELILV